MEVKSRSADPVSVAKIDELARKQGISRSLFIANMINNYAALEEEFKSYEKQYETLLERSLSVIQINTLVMQKLDMKMKDSRSKKSSVSSNPALSSSSSMVDTDSETVTVDW